MKFIAYCTKGLEDIVEDEIVLKVDDVKNIVKRSKRVIFESSLELRKLVHLETIDDIGIVISEIHPILDADDITRSLTQVKFFELKEILESYRNIDNTFSITMSAARAKVPVTAIGSTVKEYIEHVAHMEFTSLRHENFDIRIFIDEDDCVLSLRIMQSSLHNRSNAYLSREGALRAPIAAAMVLLSVQHSKGKRLVDNFSGSGTILYQAFRKGFDVFGGDIEQEAVEVTKKNLYHLQFEKEEQIKQLDATKTKWPTGFFDAAVSNLPWDKQIKVGSITDLYVGTLKEYRRIVKKDRVVVLLVSKPELLIKHAKKTFSDAKIETYPIGILGQNPTIVVIS